jgi:hypothetical protein
VFVEAQEPPAPRADMDDAVTHGQKYILLASLEAESSWIAWAAANVLSELRTTPWNPQDLLDKDMSDWPRIRAGLLYGVAILSAGPETQSLLRQAFTAESPDHRYAAWVAVASVPQLDPSGEVLSALRRDPDLTARPVDAWTEDPQPEYWSCRKCKSRNQLRDSRCQTCDHRTRPGA